VLENRGKKRICGPKSDKVIGEWIKLHNEELNIVRLMKSRRMRWARQVSRVWERSSIYRILVGKHGERTTCKSQSSMRG
jgi:hypothetical protein